MLCRIFITLISLFVLTTAVFSQSCIIYKKETDGIFIGADIRLVSYSAYGATSQVEANYSSVCKIGNVDNIYFAVTGYVADIALIEARNACQNKKILSDIVSQYVESFGQKLADALEADRGSKFEFFKKKFPAGSVLGGSVFFSYENGVLTGRVIKITLVSQPTEKATITTRNEIMDSIGIAGSAIGIRTVLFNKDIWKKGAVRGITNLIEIEKIANPNEVEGDVDILFVSSKNEKEWVRRKKCP
jgi:hypothetical protein